MNLASIKSSHLILLLLLVPDCSNLVTGRISIDRTSQAISSRLEDFTKAATTNNLTIDLMKVLPSLASLSIAETKVLNLIITDTVEGGVMLRQITRLRPF